MKNYIKIIVILTLTILSMKTPSAFSAIVPIAHCRAYCEDYLVNSQKGSTSDAYFLLQNNCSSELTSSPGYWSTQVLGQAAIWDAGGYSRGWGGAWGAEGDSYPVTQEVYTPGPPTSEEEACRKQSLNTDEAQTRIGGVPLQD